MKKAYVSHTGFGVDVASNRADDLDTLLLEAIEQQSAPSVLDLAAGAGGQALRMAAVGGQVTCVDAHDFSKQFDESIKASSMCAGNAQFVQADMLDFVQQFGKEFDFVLFQRALHYVSYAVAQEMLHILSTKTRQQLYISVSGLESAIAEYYSCRSRGIEERFCFLTVEGRELFQMHKPVCLYSHAEFTQLLRLSGWDINTCWQSAFGNHKAICSPTAASID